MCFADAADARCRIFTCRGCGRTSNSGGHVRGSHVSIHACTSVPMDAGDRNHACRNGCFLRSGMRHCDRDVVGWCSQRPRFCRRLAVRLLRVWYHRLCLVCRLVSSLLQLAVNTSSNIDSRTRVLGGNNRHRQRLGREAENAVVQNIYFRAIGGMLRSKIRTHLGLSFHTRRSATVLFRRAWFQHDQKRIPGVIAVCGSRHHAVDHRAIE